jgi:hypothetical protein
MYATIMQITGDGTNAGAGNSPNGIGPVTMSLNIPTGAIVEEIIPPFKNTIPTTLATTISTSVLAYNTFALRYDLVSLLWTIVAAADISDAAFDSTTHAGDTTGNHLDNSWLVKFEWLTGTNYRISYRSLTYTFGSMKETTFYFDDKVKVFDASTGTTIVDTINILNINTNPDSVYPLGVNYGFNVYSNIVGTDGYQDQSNVLVTYTDTNGDGIPDNPDIFDYVVSPKVAPMTRKLMFFKQNTTYGGFIAYNPIDASTIITSYSTEAEIRLNLSLYVSGQVFFTTSEQKFHKLTIAAGANSLSLVTDYIVTKGRQNLFFQYRHNSPNYRRIDPSPNNLIDMYLLTNSYASDYTAWVQDSTNTITEPTPPSTDQLSLAYSGLNKVKAISDTVIFNSASFKPLFGKKAAPALQATFMVVKNAALNISDNDIKSSVVNALNTYFAVSNWDFGETFYFTELSAYLHSALTPNISSIVIVPSNQNALFGSLFQVNAESNEIMTSCATVDNVQVISAITASQINSQVVGNNNSMVLGTIV